MLYLIYAPFASKQFLNYHISKYIIKFYKLHMGCQITTTVTDPTKSKPQQNRAEQERLEIEK